jgi:hypothetical protein
VLNDASFPFSLFERLFFKLQASTKLLAALVADSLTSAVIGRLTVRSSLVNNSSRGLSPVLTTIDF